MFLALANPLRGAVAAPTIDHFSEVHTVITALYFDRFYAGEFLDAEELLIALVIGGEPAQSALVC